MDELYEYNGKQYTLAQLQEKYGDKAQDAITKFGFKKVEQKQEETFTYKDKSFTREELEKKYGEKTEEAIEKFGFESNLKKKVDSESTSSDPKLDSEAKNTDGLSATPNVIELSDEEVGLTPSTNENPKTPEEKKSFLSNTYTNLKAGFNDFNKMVTSIPEAVYDIFSMPQNAVAWATGIDIETSSKKFKEQNGIKNPVLDAYRKEGEKLNKEIESFNQENYESSSIYDNVKKGNYQDAFELITSSVVRSAPVSVSMMVGGATMTTSELATIGTVAFTNTNREEIESENPEMSEIGKTIKSIGLSGAEMVFSAIGEGTIGNVYKDIIKREGKEVGKEIFKKGLINAYKKSLEKHGVVAGAMGEMLEEGATQVTQNMINGKPYMEGVFDAMAVGGASGTVMAAPMSINKAKNKIKGIVKAKQASKTMSKENKTKIDDIDNAVEKVDNDLKQDIPDSIREKLQVVKEKLETEKEKTIESDYEKFKNLPQEQKEKLGDLEEKLDVLKSEYDEIENNQDISQESKDLLKKEKADEATKLLSEKQSIIDAKSETPTTETKEQAVETATPDTNAEKGQEKGQEKGVEDVPTPTVELSVENVNKIDGIELKNENRDILEEKYTELDNERSSVDSKLNSEGKEFTEERNVIAEKQAKLGEWLEKDRKENRNQKPLLPNETTPKANTKPNADVQPNIEPNIQQGKDNGLQPTPNVGEVKNEVEVKENINHAVKEVNKGILAWDGNPFSSRVDLGISRADVRKGEADIKKGNYTSVPAKRVIEALAQAKKQGYYDYMEGSGGKVGKIQVPLTEQLDADTELSVQELEEINKNEENLSNDYDSWVDTLDDNTINEIYENNSREEGVVEKPTKIGEGKNDVQNKQEPKPKTKDERIKVANAKVDDIANAIKGIDEIFGIKIKVDDVEGLARNGVDMIDVVASIAKKAIAAGIEIDVAIQKTIEHLKKTLDFDVNVDDVKAKINEKPKKEAKKTNNKKQTKISERFRKGNNDELIDNIINSLSLNSKGEQGNVEKAARKANFGVIEYEQRRQEKVYNDTLKFIDKVGVFAAYESAKNGKIENDDTRNAIYAIILDKKGEVFLNISETTKNEDDQFESMDELADFFEDVLKSYALAAKNAGQGISMIGFLHQKGLSVKYDLPTQIALEEQRTGKDITKERRKELRERDKIIKEQDARIKELLAEQEKQKAQAGFDNAIAFEDLAKNKKTQRKKRKLSDKDQQRKKELAKKLRNKYLGAFNDVTRVATMIADVEMLEYLKITLKEAGGNFLNFSEDVVEAFGKGIKKHIPELYKKVGGKEDTSLYDDTPSEIKVEDGKIIISRKVLRELVEEGVTDIDVAAKTIRERNIEILEDFTIRDVRDALTNYGKTREVNKDPILKTVRLLKRLGILLSKMDDAKAGIRPSKTGLIRDPSTPLEREYNKLLNDLLDKLPVDEVDLENKIKTRVDKKITTLKNTIADLDLQIKNKKRNERTVKATITNDRIEELEAEKKAKQEELNDLVGVPVRTLEQKLQTRENQIDAQIKKLKKQLDNNDVDFKKTNQKLSNAQIEIKEKELEALRTKRDELRENLGIFYQQRLEARKAAVKRAIEDRRTRIREGNFEARKPKPLKEDSELKKLLRDNQRLKEKYDVEAEIHRLKNRSFLEQLKDNAIGFLNAFRAIILNFEMSFTGIQGFVLMTDKTFTRRNVTSLKNKIKNINRSDVKNLKSAATVSKDILKGIESFKALSESIGSIVDDSKHKDSQYDLKNHPRYELVKKYVQLVEDNGIQDEHFVGMDFINGVAHILVTQPAEFAEKTIRKKLNKLKPELSLDEQNTVIADVLVKLNPMKALERGNMRFLNDLRLQEFMLGVEAMELNGKTEETHPQDYKALGRMVNTVTGTSTLHPVLKQSIPLLNTIFLAFRFTVSMANQSILAIPYTVSLYGQRGNISYAQKRYTKLMIKSYALIGAATYGLYWAATLAWLDDEDREEKNKPRIEFDPRSSDFMSVIEGDVATSILGSRKKHVVLAARLFTGETKNSKGEIIKSGVGYKTPTDADILIRYGINHLNILPRFGMNYLYGHDELIDGEEKRIIDYGDEIEEVGILDQVKGVKPMIIDTYKELIEEDPYMLKPLMIASFFGQQISIYSRQSEKEVMQKKMDDRVGRPERPTRKTREEKKASRDKKLENERELKKKVEKLGVKYVRPRR